MGIKSFIYENRLKVYSFNPKKGTSASLRGCDNFFQIATLPFDVFNYIKQILTENPVFPASRFKFIIGMQAYLQLGCYKSGITAKISKEDISQKLLGFLKKLESGKKVNHAVKKWKSSNLARKALFGVLEKELISLPYFSSFLNLGLTNLEDFFDFNPKANTKYKEIIVTVGELIKNDQMDAVHDIVKAVKAAHNSKPGTNVWGSEEKLVVDLESVNTFYFRSQRYNLMKEDYRKRYASILFNLETLLHPIKLQD